MVSVWEELVPMAENVDTYTFAKQYFINLKRRHPLDEEIEVGKTEWGETVFEQRLVTTSGQGILTLNWQDERVRLVVVILRACEGAGIVSTEFPFEHFKASPMCQAFLLLALRDLDAGRSSNDTVASSRFGMVAVKDVRDMKYTTASMKDYPCKFAENILKDPEQPKNEYLLLAALKIIGLYGNKEDLPLLEPYFKRVENLKIFVSASWAEYQINQRK